MFLNTNSVFKSENGIDLFVYATLLSGFKLEEKLLVVLEEAQLFPRVLSYMTWVRIRG